jgi:hypothetical protein
LPRRTKTSRVEPFSADVEYEGFCDTITSTFKRGAFLVCLGHRLPGGKDKWVARFWVDPVAYKDFSECFSAQIKKYQKEYGGIKEK